MMSASWNGFRPVDTIRFIKLVQMFQKKLIIKIISCLVFYCMPKLLVPAHANNLCIFLSRRQYKFTEDMKCIDDELKTFLNILMKVTWLYRLLLECSIKECVVNMSKQINTSFINKQIIKILLMKSFWKNRTNSSFINKYGFISDC